MKRVTARVKPGSKKGPLVMADSDGLVIYVRERAVDGKANEAVIKLAAEYYATSKSSVKIIQGQTGRVKTLQVG